MSKEWGTLGEGKLLETGSVFEDVSCPKCGDEMQLYTGASEGRFFEGDTVRCTNCDFTSTIESNNDGTYYIRREIDESHTEFVVKDINSWNKEFYKTVNSLILSAIKKKLEEKGIQVDDIEDYCLKNLKFHKTQQYGFPINSILKVYTKFPFRLLMVIKILITLEDNFTFNITISSTEDYERK